MAADESEIERIARMQKWPAHEDGLAEVLVDRNPNLRWTQELGDWSTWNVTHWTTERTLAVFDMARELCRESAAHQEKESHAAPLRKAATVAAVERLARSDRRVAATVEQWDSHPMLLNTPSGTVDLETGDVRPHEPADMLRKITRGQIKPLPWQALAPRWGRFLEELTDGDDDLRYYLQRLCGYAATGVVKEHVLPFIFGPGGNGKGTLIETVAYALGPYARAMPEGFLEQRQADSHPTELADLLGVRLAYASETRAGSGWNEARLKALTGGDTIKARKMRQDFFEFPPTHKLIVIGNNQPAISSVDDAIRRRIQVVPLEFKPPKLDPDLPDVLKAEVDGVLMWIVEGARMWLEEGLDPPVAVTKESETYFDSQDPLGEWIEQCCVTGENWDSSITPLLNSYKEWSEINGMRPFGRKRLGNELHKRGFKRRREMNSRRHEGIALK